jgi:streptogramin lyase
MSSRTFPNFFLISSFLLAALILTPSSLWAKHRRPTPTVTATPTVTCSPTETPVPLPASWTGQKLYVFDAMWGSKGAGLGELNLPEGIAIGPSDNLYICDTGNNRILIWTSEGRPLRAIGSFGSSATWRNAPQFNHPAGILVLPKGQYYVADTLNHRIVVVDSNDLVLSSWGSQGVSNGQFVQPRDIKRDHFGNIWVLDSGNSRFENFSNAGVFNFAWGSYGTQDGQLNLPLGFALNNIDQAIVADTSNFRIQVFNDQSSATTNLAPVTVEGWFGDGPFQFKEPTGVVINKEGQIAVVDGLTARVEFFNNRFEFLGQWRAKDDILNTNYAPRFRGIACDSQDRLYLTDTQNDCVVRLKPLKNQPTPTAAPTSSANALPTPTAVPEDSTPYGKDYPIR